jgi:hypothetical protein
MRTAHDWTLKTIHFDWMHTCATISFDSANTQNLLLIAQQVADIHVPAVNPWGPSASVNEIVGPCDSGNGLKKLEIEMQSGDVIVLIARNFQLPISEGQN